MTHEFRFSAAFRVHMCVDLLEYYVDQVMCAVIKEQSHSNSWAEPSTVADYFVLYYGYSNIRSDANNFKEARINIHAEYRINTSNQLQFIINFTSTFANCHNKLTKGKLIAMPAIESTDIC